MSKENKKIENEAIKSEQLSDEFLEKITGGNIVCTQDGKFKVVDDATGINCFSGKLKFDTLDQAIEAAKIAGVGTIAISKQERKMQMQKVANTIMDSIDE